MLNGKYCSHTEPPYFKACEDRMQLADKLKHDLIDQYVSAACASDLASSSEEKASASKCLFAKTLVYGQLMSHLYWALWGLIESQTDRVDVDFAYEDYGKMRFQEYWLLLKRTQEE